MVPATESPFKAEPAPNPRHLAASIRGPGVKLELEIQTPPSKSRLAPKDASKAKPAPKKASPPLSSKVVKKEEPNTSRWSDARIETASNYCVEVLREHGGRYMPRQEVRALARAKGVGDTGLLDHVLKNISERRVILTKTAPKAEKGTRVTIDPVFFPTFLLVFPSFRASRRETGVTKTSQILSERGPGSKSREPPLEQCRDPTASRKSIQSDLRVGSPG